MTSTQQVKELNKKLQQDEQENRKEHLIFSAREEPSPTKEIPQPESPRIFRRISSDRGFSSTKKTGLIDNDGYANTAYFIKPRILI